MAIIVRFGQKLWPLCSGSFLFGGCFGFSLFIASLRSLFHSFSVRVFLQFLSAEIFCNYISLKRRNVVKCWQSKSNELMRSRVLPPAAGRWLLSRNLLTFVPMLVLLLLCCCCSFCTYALHLAASALSIISMISMISFNTFLLSMAFRQIIPSQPSEFNASLPICRAVRPLGNLKLNIMSFVGICDGHQAALLLSTGF